MSELIRGGAENHFAADSPVESLLALPIEGGYELALPLPLDKERVEETTERLDLTEGKAYSSLMDLVQSGSVSYTTEGEVVAGFRVNAPIDYHHSGGTVFKAIFPQDGEKPRIIIKSLGYNLHTLEPDGSVSYVDFGSENGEVQGEAALWELSRGHALRALRHEEAIVSPLDETIG